MEDELLVRQWKNRNKNKRTPYQDQLSPLPAIHQPHAAHHVVLDIPPDRPIALISVYEGCGGGDDGNANL